MNKKRIGFIIGALMVLLIAFFLMPRNDEDAQPKVNEAASSKIIASTELRLLDYNGKKNLMGKWVFTGRLNNTSQKIIEKVEFELKFSDNTEFVMYEEKIHALEPDHTFEFKVTGHKKATLMDVEVRTVYTK